ncbi:MAG: HIT family protein, partial [Patescibacteria group bacterium]
MSKDPDFYSPEIQKSARQGGYKYAEIWQSVDKCPFCDLKEKYIVTQDNDVVLTANLFPYVDYHLLIIPRKHVLLLSELSENDWLAVRRLAELGRKLLEAVTNNDAYTFVLREGNNKKKTVQHLHFHLIPFHPDLESWQYQKIN